MKLRCRLGLHKTKSTRLPASEVGLQTWLNRCVRADCTHQTTSTTLAIGWVNETICDDLLCFTDGEHPVHEQRQLDRISWQRRTRNAASAAV